MTIAADLSSPVASDDQLGRRPRARPIVAPLRPTRRGDAADPLTIGRRLRHLRKAGGQDAGRCRRGRRRSRPSALSLIENGKREAKLSLLERAGGRPSASTLADLLTVAAPSRRAALEIELEKAQRADAFKALDIPAVRPGPRLPTEALESLVGLHRALARMQAERAATPEQARRANADLRDRMRRQGNYFGEIETVGRRPADRHQVRRRPDHPDRGRPAGAHLGFRLVHTNDLPESTRTVTDLGHRIIYLPQPDAGPARFALAGAAGARPCRAGS